MRPSSEEHTRAGRERGLLMGRRMAEPQDVYTGPSFSGALLRLTLQAR